MKLDDVKDLAQKKLSADLGSYGFDHIVVEARKDHDDEDALFMTAVYRKGSKLPGGAALNKALAGLRSDLLSAGDERFPYLTHRVEDEETEFEDEDVHE